jgi:hypothetical protein
MKVKITLHVKGLSGKPKIELHFAPSHEVGPLLLSLPLKNWASGKDTAISSFTWDIEPVKGAGLDTVDMVIRVLMKQETYVTLKTTLNPEGEARAQLVYSYH